MQSPDQAWGELRVGALPMSSLDSVASTAAGRLILRFLSAGGRLWCAQRRSGRLIFGGGIRFGEVAAGMRRAVRNRHERYGQTGVICAYAGANPLSAELAQQGSAALRGIPDHFGIDHLAAMCQVVAHTADARR
jgi:hypothetical protein